MGPDYFFKGVTFGSYARNGYFSYVNLLKDNPNHWFYALGSVGTSMYRLASENGGGTVEEMAAVIRAFSAEPWRGGLLWWKWDEENYRPQFHDDPAGDKGFTIDGKPAAQVMKHWCEGGGRGI